jgi:ribonuclease PH
MRIDGRKVDELRPVTIQTGYVEYPEGSVLYTSGKTIVLCNVSAENGVPRWMQLQGHTGGWLTAEYAMLPGSTPHRTPRENNGLTGRSQEIRRLIGRSLRAAIDLTKLGERTLIVDCDVIQADGGTRTASITGGFIALALAVKRMVSTGLIPQDTLKTSVASVSVGVVHGQPLLDLCYQEDAHADVDMNVIMNKAGDYIEVQSTAEVTPFNHATLERLLDLARYGISALLTIQDEALAR